MKHLLLLFFIIQFLSATAQESVQVSGTVYALPDNNPLPNASIIVKGTSNGAITDIDGNFSLQAPAGSTITISYIGYAGQEYTVTEASESLTFHLEEDETQLGEVEVYATGYQELPAERVTGSFEHIDNDLLNRSVSTDVISRLEGVTNGLWFDTRGADIGSTNRNNYRDLRIRGISTLHSDTNPLIVVNDFPYNGDITNINPNDIESITVLKDAAAASIWGARAGNGVIVITTKSGRMDQPMQINVTANTTVEEAPDLYRNPSFLASEDFINLERTLFEQGLYESAENSIYLPVLSPAVEALIQERDGLITNGELNDRLNNLAQNDVRRDAAEELFQPAVRQQYAVNLQGGSTKASYYASAGYDHNTSNLQGVADKRFTLNNKNTFHLSPRLTLQNNLFISTSDRRSNGIGWGGNYTLFPYNQLVDEDGNPAVVPRGYRSTYLAEAEDQGLLDWYYRPLEERNLRVDRSSTKEYRINASLNYELLEGLDLGFRYQYQFTDGHQNVLTDRDSYQVRNQVNQYTQDDGSRPFPYGDMLYRSNSRYHFQAGRLQATYEKKWAQHEVNALVGVERRQEHFTSESQQLYGFDDQVLTHQDQLDYVTRFRLRPRGRSYLSPPGSGLEDLVDRYISWYGNASYRFANRYMATFSARRDASNLFGVKTNQRSVPLWSVGVGWELTNEPFIQLPGNPYLKLRATIGANGNVNKQATAFTTMQYTSPSVVNLASAYIANPGNPQLRWERIKVWNLGLDFGFIEDRINGSVEYFQKRGEDLLGNRITDPTTGFVSNNSSASLVNYANTKTQGIDLTVNAQVLKGPISWDATVIYNYNRTKLSRYEIDEDYVPISTYFSNANLKLKEGSYIDDFYSIPWNGLSSSGDPIVYVEDQVSTDYRTYYSNLTFSDLVKAGSAVPPSTGAFRNTVSYKGVALSFNITWKTGYYFRRSSINYEQFVNDWTVHEDVADRWMQPGDEAHTDVPSVPEEIDNYRDYVYTYSDHLIERGDHIRLQDINLSYTLPSLPSMIRTARVFLYVRNPGILWKATDKDLDPDFSRSALRPGRSISLGINLGL